MKCFKFYDAKKWLLIIRCIQTNILINKRFHYVYRYSVMRVDKRVKNHRLIKQLKEIQFQNADMRRIRQINQPSTAISMPGAFYCSEIFHSSIRRQSTGERNYKICSILRLDRYLQIFQFDRVFSWLELLRDKLLKIK